MQWANIIRIVQIQLSLSVNFFLNFLSVVLSGSQAQDSFSCGDARAFFLILLQPRQKAQQLLEIYLPLFLKSRKPLLEIYLPLWNLNGDMVQLLLGNTRLYCLFNELVVVLDLLDCQGFFFAIFFFFFYLQIWVFFLYNPAKEKGLEFQREKAQCKDRMQQTGGYRLFLIFVFYFVIVL